MIMDSKQADAVVQAILDPHLKSRNELQHKRQKKAARRAARLSVQRRVVACALIGMAIGGVVGHFTYGQFARGIIIGGIVAFFVTHVVLAVVANFSPTQSAQAWRDESGI